MSAKRNSKKPSDRKPGRPKLELDAKLIENLAGIGCPNKEIAAVAGCSVDTLERNFAAVIEKGRENCKTRLRKKQIEVALGGNVVMLIWLGKQILGQAEKIEQKTEFTETPALPLSQAQARALDEFVAGIRKEIKCAKTKG